MSGRKRILMVDDDEVFCELTQEILEDLGYDFAAASDVDKARAVFLHHDCQFDLIMVDHVLSGIHGEDLAAEFLRCCPGIPIALYTGAVVSLDEVRSKGIRAVIPKPLTKAELADALEKILNGP